MNKGIIKLLLAVFCFVFLIGPALAADVNLSVAASLREAVTELSADFAKKNTGVTFQRNFGASGALAKQIENGAPCDLFFSANVEWVDYLQKKKLIDEWHVSTFAFNELVFVGKPVVKVQGMRDLVKLEKIAIGSPQSVPAGEYAMAALKKSGMDKELERKLVMAKDVRACLMYAEQGEVDGSFVYKTDALLARNTGILFIVPQELYPQVTYPKGLTAIGSKNKDAVAFFSFLNSAEARYALGQLGFTAK